MPASPIAVTKALRPPQLPRTCFGSCAQASTLQLSSTRYRPLVIPQHAWHTSLSRKQHCSVRCHCSQTQRGEKPPSWKHGAVPLLAAGLLLLAPTTSWAASDIGDIFVGPPRVVDGDTLVVAGERVRLFGVDAPESKQTCQTSRGQPYACGQTATDALKAVIGDSSIQCQVRAIDLYGRNVSACTLPGTGDISDWLVKNGHAVAYRQYSKAYVADEEAAKMAHKGIWQGQFEIPAEWRRDKKSHSRSSSTDSIVASAPAPQSAGSALGPLASLRNFLQLGSSGRVAPMECNIKGNISGKGEKIYHTPGGRYYEGVKIEPRKGEAFFCTVKDAEEAGFRPSRE